MKQLILMLGITLMAFPALAQDFGDGGSDGSFSNFDDSFGNSLEFSTAAPEVDVLADVRRWLEMSGAPLLDKKQEKSLKSLYNKEIKAMAKVFKTEFGVSLDSAIASQGRVYSSRQPQSAAQKAEVRRLTQELSDKIVAALPMNQQAPLRRYQSEQLRISRETSFKKRIETAGISLSPEQKPEIEALFARESRLRTLMFVEAKGGPTAQKQISLLEVQTSQRIVGLLDQAQKDALTAASAKSKTASSVPARPEAR